jgi:hypothetical protein
MEKCYTMVSIDDTRGESGGIHPLPEAQPELHDNELQDISIPANTVDHHELKK